MENATKRLKELIDSAGKILITSHIGPDGDSVCSMLLALKILHLNFQDKQVFASMEEKPYGLEFLDGLEDITVRPLIESLEDIKPDLLLILDANTVSRISRNPEETRKYLQIRDVRTVIIDHHEPVGVEDNDLYINNFSPAVTLDIYELLLDKMGLSKPDNYAQVAMTGIYTDTGGFINRNLNYTKTFDVLPKLIKDGADIEKVANDLARIDEMGLEMFAKFINNMKLEKDYVYTFMPDSVMDKADEKTVQAVKQAADLVRSGFLRNIGNRQWGYILYRDLLAGTRTYSVSFRAVSDAKDVSILASKLGGGGHKPAAGAKIESSSAEEAVKKVESVIAANS